MNVVHSLVSELDPHGAHQGEHLPAPAAYPPAAASEILHPGAVLPAAAAPVSSAP